MPSSRLGVPVPITVKLAQTPDDGLLRVRSLSRPTESPSLRSAAGRSSDELKLSVLSIDDSSRVHGPGPANSATGCPTQCSRGRAAGGGSSDSDSVMRTASLRYTHGQSTSTVELGNDRSLRIRESTGLRRSAVAREGRCR
eukprot:768540-Hanusia_phi.AAC.2